MQLKDWTSLYKQPAPEFGHDLLNFYAFDPNYINLNNGSYGSTPRPVLRAVEELTATIEANPDLFHRITYSPLLNDVRAKLASLIGAKTDEVVLVSNASMGVNTVLRNFNWEQGDIIFSFTTTYNSISKTVEYLADINTHLNSQVITLNFPTTHAEIVKLFKAHVLANPAAPNKKRVAVIDSIVSNPGVMLPWKEMVDICKKEGIWTVIDAAHSIGQEVGVNLTQSAPDFWISNCHKWLSAKRSCAVLYVPERNQHIIKSSIPTSKAYNSPQDRKEPNFVEQFHWNGTIDFAPFLTVKDALEYREWLGGEEKINAYCHDLAIKGGKVLAKVFETRVMDPEGDLTLNMVNVQLPFPKVYSEHIHQRLQVKMLVEKDAYSAHFFHNGAWWTRCSAQVWNNLDDFKAIGKKWLQACLELAEEHGLQE